MGRAPSHRRHRISLVAIVVTLASLVLVGWAVRGLLQDTVAETAAFGQTSVADPAPVPGASAQSAPGAGKTFDQVPAAGVGRSTAADTSTAAASPPPTADPSAAAGSTSFPSRAPAELPLMATQPQPVRLSVPALDLDMELDSVGVAPDGLMQIPDDPDRAGWYRYGPVPGELTGSAVVAAHIDDDVGPGPFFELTKVAEGVEVVVELADGTHTTYQVVGGEQVAKSDLAIDEIFRREGDPVLRLVTCSGDWSPRAGSYTDNLVITAVPVP